MPKYPHSRDVLTTLIESLHKLAIALWQCVTDGWVEITKLFFQFFYDVKNGRWSLRLGAIGALLCILIPSFWQWRDNIVTGIRWWNREEIIEQYARVIEQEYEKELYAFFLKYHERFMSYDCDWMAEFGADRAMYDKYKRTKISNYKCEEFIKTEAKWYLPYKIDKPIREDDIFRISLEAIMLLERMDEGTILAPVKMEIWKKHDWNMWHLTKQPVKLPAKMIGQ